MNEGKDSYLCKSESLTTTDWNIQVLSARAYIREPSDAACPL